MSSRSIARKKGGTLTRAEVKEMLQSYQKMIQERKHIEAMMQKMMATLGGSSPQSDGLPRSNKTSNPTAEKAFALADLKERYERKVEELARKCNDIEDMIERLDPNERRLIRLRYIEGMQWERVCVAMHYSWKQVHRIHGRILDKLAQDDTQ